jgi:hypothetical protein
MPGERRFTCRPVQPREGAVHFGGDAKVHVVAGGIGSSAAGTTAARLTGPREAEPTRVRGAPPCHHRLNLGSGRALGSLIPRRCELGLSEDQPILPTLGLPVPSGVLCSLQVVCRCPTRRTSAGDTERPRLASSWALVPGRSLVARPPSRQSPHRSPRRCSSSRPAHKPSSRGPGPRGAPIYRNWNVIQNSLIHQCGLVPATLRCDRLAVERKNR